MAKSGQRLTIYFDGWCPLCTAIRERLQRLDWRGRIGFASIREPRVAESLGIDAERLAARLHVRHEVSGRVVDGIDSVVAIAGQLPALWPLWPFLWLIARIGLGQPLYDYLANRRRIIPVGACDTEGCPLPGVMTGVEVAQSGTLEPLRPTEKE